MKPQPGNDETRCTLVEQLIDDPLSIALLALLLWKALRSPLIKTIACIVWGAAPLQGAVGVLARTRTTEAWIPQPAILVDLPISCGMRRGNTPGIALWMV